MVPDPATATVEELFAAAGALQTGHFRLKSGRHADLYLEKFAVLQYPAVASELCRRLAEALAGEEPEVVVGPTTGGVLLAFETARHLESHLGRTVRGLFAEPGGDGGRVLRRGFQVGPDERVVVVDDILTSGASVRETVDAVRAAGGTVRAAAVIVDRSDGRAEAGVPLVALARLDIPSWQADECPLCAAGAPLHTPGSSTWPNVP